MQEGIILHRFEHHVVVCFNAKHYTFPAHSINNGMINSNAHPERTSPCNCDRTPPSRVSIPDKLAALLQNDIN